MIQLNFLLSQTCSCHYNFGTNSSSVSYWSSAGVGGNGYLVDKTVCVKGKLIIDENVSFLTSNFYMYPGSTISVSNYNVFKAASTKFQRCGSEMWNGIVTTLGSELDFNNNTISDAIYGVFTYPNSIISQFIKNKFNRCSIGILADLAISKKPFVGNRFYSDGTMLSPHAGQFPFMGMRLIGTDITERSGFYEHMNRGIDLNNCTYTGEKITIQNGPTSITTIDPGIGLSASGSNFTINNSTIQRTPFGIWADGGSSGTVTNNHFYNVAFGIFFQNSANLGIKINNNILDTIRTFGIIVRECSPHLETLISDNMVSFSTNSIYGLPNQYCMGITVDHDGDFVEAGKEIQILSNHVYQNGALPQFFYGYFLYNTWSILMNANTADYETPNTNSTWGIYTNNCSRVNLTSNTLTGGGTNTPLSTGIYLNLTHLSQLCCNTTNLLDIGIEFSDVCLDTRLRGSILNGPYSTNSLLFNFTVTGIKQLYPGNDWLGVAPVDARYVGDQLEAEENYFLVSTPDLPFHPDDPIDGPSLWFRVLGDHENNCAQDENCDGFPETSCDDYPNDQLLLVDGYNGLHGEGLTWQSRKIVLKEFWKDPDFGCNTSLVNNFKNQHQNSNLGLIAQLTNDINAMLALSPAITQNLESLSNTISYESQAIIPIDSMWEVEGADLEYWTQQRDIHLMNLLDAWTEYKTILEANHSEVLAAIPTLQSNLNQITPSNIMEENDVFITGIYLEKLLDPDLVLSTTQLNNLNDIADQCPLDGGDGVIRARSMLWSMNLEDFHPGVTCDGMLGPRFNTTVDGSFGINLLPNPSQGTFVMELNDNSKNPEFIIRIFDMNGRIIKSYNTSQKILDIDILERPGIYYLNVKNLEGLTINKNFLVIK